MSNGNVASRLEGKEGPAIAILARKHFQLETTSLQSTLRGTECKFQFSNDIYQKVLPLPTTAVEPTGAFYCAASSETAGFAAVFGDVTVSGNGKQQPLSHLVLV